jgi:hypothetical protein
MDKKALLMKSVLGLIIGVLSISILIVLAFGMYNLFIKPTQLEKAKASLNGLVAEIDRLEEGAESDYLIVNPEGWAVILEGNKLISCDFEILSGKISNFVSEGESRETKIDKCLRNGVFKEINTEALIEDRCFESNCVIFEELPLTLFLKKENGVVIISKKESKEFLDYRIDVDSKSILEFSKEIVLNKENKEKKEELKKELEEVINNYAGEKVYWRITIYEFYEDKPDEGRLGMVGNHAEYYFADEIKEESFVFVEDNHTYHLEFKIGVYED